MNKISLPPCFCVADFKQILTSVFNKFLEIVAWMVFGVKSLQEWVDVEFEGLIAR